MNDEKNSSIVEIACIPRDALEISTERVGLCVVIGGRKLKERFIPRIVRLPWICSTTFTVEFGATTEKDVNCSDRGLLIYGLGVRRLQKKSCRIRIRVRTRRRAGAVEDHAVLSREPEAKVGGVPLTSEEQAHMVSCYV